MSLTDAQHVFVSAHETALNDLINAICSERPRLLVYGSPAFTPVTTVTETRMDPIPFPGIGGGIEWRISFGTPRIDLFKQTDPLPPELVLPFGGLSLRTTVELCLDCRRVKIDREPDRRDDRGRHEDDRVQIDREQDRLDDSGRHEDDRRHPLREVTCCRLDVFVIGHVQSVVTPAGERAIAFGVDAVEVVDVAPPEVEAILECLLYMILQAVLADIQIPLRALRVGAFELSITVGPLIEDDQVKARGNF
jgi:hypothetical protein